MTFKEAKERLNRINVSIKKIDGEYRVNYKHADDITSYYTNDLNDAVQTAENYYTK